ncbi:hypothetical protein [Sphingomonas sp. 3-13AW]|uniref:hypothetical protein n=1 Tax=Sphingomonas sp. 3-13AW TaxID=3050450 RepID=UPI003BB5C651
MKHIILMLAGLLAATPATAQEAGSLTLVITPMPGQLEALDSATLAAQVRSMLDQGALSGTRVPLILDGKPHEQTVRLGGEPAVYVDRGVSLTAIPGVQREIRLSYGPAQSGGIGVHAEIVDSMLTMDSGGYMTREKGPTSEVTGVVPADGRPQAIIKKSQALPGSIVLPDSYIILVEP